MQRLLKLTCDLPMTYNQHHTYVIKSRYEGGGLFRNTYLISTSQLHAVPHGVFAPAYFYNGFKTRSTPAMGMTANNAFLRPEATIVGSSASSSVSVVFQLYARGGSVALATAKVSSVTIVPGIATLVTGSEMSCNNTELWTVARPFLHTIVATISDGATVADVVNVTAGLRQQHWDPVSLLLFIYIYYLLCSFLVGSSLLRSTCSSLIYFSFPLSSFISLLSSFFFLSINERKYQ